MEFKADETITLAFLYLNDKRIATVGKDKIEVWLHGTMTDRFSLLLNAFQPAYVYQAGDAYKRGKAIEDALYKIRDELDYSDARMLWNDNVRKKVGIASMTQFLWDAR